MKLNYRKTFDVEMNLEHFKIEPCSFEPTPSRVKAYCVSRNSFASSILSTLQLIKYNLCTINVCKCFECQSFQLLLSTDFEVEFRSKSKF